MSDPTYIYYEDLIEALSSIGINFDDSKEFRSLKIAEGKITVERLRYEDDEFKKPVILIKEVATTVTEIGIKVRRYEEAIKNVRMESASCASSG